MSKTQDALKLAQKALEELLEEQSYWWQEVESDIVKALEKAESACKQALADQPAHPIRWNSAAVDMTGAMATLPKTGSESVVDYKFVDGTKVSETRATVEDGVVTSVTITNTAPPYINSTGADANIAGIPGTYYGIVPKGTGKITVTSPPASKPWVGLSTDEIYDMYNEPRSDAEMVEFARAIEAKLREKNA